MSTQTISNIYKQTRRNRTLAKVDGSSSNEPKKTGQQRKRNKSDREILRDFDLTLEYGPCIGISRLERWERAHKHGLNPPSEVKDTIMKQTDNAAYTQRGFHQCHDDNVHA